MYSPLLIVMLVHQALSCMPGYNTQFNGLCVRIGQYAGCAVDNDYNTATSKCSADGTTLPSIHSDEENNLYATLSGGKHVILGLYCDLKKQQYAWQDGTPVNYTNFGNGYTNTCNNNDNYHFYTYNGDIYKKWYHLPFSSNNCAGSANGYCVQSLIKSDPCDDYTSIPGGKGDSGICYSLMSVPATWQDAEKNCRADFAHLMSIHGKAQNDFLRRVAVSRGLLDGAHIGISTADGVQNFTWSDGTTMDYEQYSPGFPDADFGLCGALETGTPKGDWVNVDCDTPLSYFCGRPALSMSTQSPPICPDAIIFTEGQEITSPGYPLGFPSDMECDYVVKVGSGKKAQIEVVHFETNACCDFLHVFNGSLGNSEIASLSGSNLSGNKYAASKNILRLSWRPTSGVVVKGWKVLVEAV